jgi:hypothetical protein
MDNEQKKSRLSEYVLLRIEAENMEERLARLRSEEKIPPMRMGDGSGHTGGNGDRMERAIIRRVEYEERNGPKIKEAREKMNYIEDAISAVRNPLERTVLRLRYLEADDANLTKWKDVAVGIYGDDDEKDLRAVHRLHASALSHIVFEEN